MLFCSCIRNILYFFIYVNFYECDLKEPFADNTCHSHREVTVRDKMFASLNGSVQYVALNYLMVSSEQKCSAPRA